MLKVAFIVPENRDEHQTYDLPEPVFGPAPAALLNGFSQFDDCEIHVIGATKRPVAAPPKIARNIFFHSVHAPSFARFRTLYSGSILGIRRLLHRIQPDIVHGQGSERYAAMAAAMSGFPNVVTLHGIFNQIVHVQREGASFLRATAALERFALRRTGGVICLSHHGEKIVRRFNSRIWVVPNGVDEKFFDVPRAPVQPPELVVSANIYELKNHAGLIQALDPLAARHSFKLNLLGKLVTGDPAAARVEEMARARPWVQMHGFVAPDALRHAISRATMLVHPSLEENCPMAIIEGMSAGIPIAASRAGGIPDLVEHGVNGLLFDPRKPADISAVIDRLLTEAPLAEQLARAARAKAEKEFRPRAIAKRHLEIYRELLQR